MIKKWNDINNKVELIYQRCNKTGGLVDICLVAPLLIEAGKSAYEFLCRDTNNHFGLDKEFYDIPEYPTTFIAEDNRDIIQFYGCYWLCLLVALAEKEHIMLLNPKFKKLYFHPNKPLPLLQNMRSDFNLKKHSTIYDTEFIKDICLGSQQVCEIINRSNQIEKQKFIFPETHISSTQIFEIYKINPQTVSTWAKKAKANKVLFFDEDKLLNEITLTDIVRSTEQGRPMGYPKWWIDEKLKTYQPKPNYENS